jgi:hypothetical protein
MIKQFCRLVVKDELDNEEVSEFYDIVTSIVPAKVVVATTDDDQTVSVEVTVFENNQGEYVYEIILQEHIDESEGDKISQELEDVFNLDFEFEISMEI